MFTDNSFWATVTSRLTIRPMLWNVVLS